MINLTSLLAQADQNSLLDHTKAKRVSLIEILADDSGSMSPHRDATVAALQEAGKIFVDAETSLVTANRCNTLRISVEGLNAGTLIAECHPTQLGDFSQYRINGGTPLVRRMTEMAKAIDRRIGESRSRGQKADGHLIIFSDGEATDGSPQGIEDLKNLLQNLRERKQGGSVGVHFVCIGTAPRAFAESIGIPQDCIHDVPAAMGPVFAEMIKRISTKVSQAAGAVLPGPGENTSQASGDALFDRLRGSMPGN